MAPPSRQFTAAIPECDRRIRQRLPNYREVLAFTQWSICGSLKLGPLTLITDSGGSDFVAYFATTA